MTITEDKPDTETTAPEAVIYDPSEVAGGHDRPDVIVEVPRPVAVGDIAVKTSIPQVYDGLVIATDTGADQLPRAYVVGRREEGGDWKLIRTSVESLARHELPGDVPGIAEIGVALAEAQADVEMVREQHRIELVHARTEMLEATNALAAYKTRVRERILANADAYSWEGNEVNELLEELGLPTITHNFRVPVDLTAAQTVYITVEAENEDAAVEQVQEMSDSDILSEANANDWDISDSWSVDRYNVEEVDD